MAVKPTLSRENLYVPIEEMNLLPATLNVNALAFKTAGTQPAELDWIAATVVDDSGDPLWNATVGPAFVLLVGPDRGDSVVTEDPGEGDWQVWVDAAVTGSDERIVRVAGVLEITPTGS